MLEYTKSLLQKVSFDKFLFVKELGKSLKRLQEEEIINLRYWCFLTFAPLYKKEMEQVFQTIALPK